MGILDDFSLDDLRAFGLIASAGGISAAAKRFEASKASLSRALNRLELRARAPLFDRLSGGLRLTPLGETLHAAAESAVRLAQETEQTMRAAHGVPQGPLRIAASALGSQVLLVPVIAELNRRYPAVQTSLTVTNEWPNPVTEDFDVVLRIGRPKEAYLVIRRIFSTKLRLYTARKWNGEVDLQDPAVVKQLGRIVINVVGVPSVWKLGACDGRTIELASEPIAAVGDPGVALGILRSGIGMAFLFHLYGEPLVESGEFVRVLADFEGPAIGVYATLPPRRANVPAVRAFLELLDKQVAATLARRDKPVRSPSGNDITQP